VSTATRAIAQGLQLRIADDAVLDSFHVTERERVALDRAWLVPAGVHLAGHPMVITALGPGQFSGLDRLGGRHSPASGSGTSASAAWRT